MNYRRITIITIIGMLFLGSISEATQTNKQSATNVVLQNFAVVWRWLEEDTKMVDKYMSEQFEQFLGLVKAGTIENVYYDSDPSHRRGGVYPNISFILRAASLEDARRVLSKMVFVQNKISSYTLHPVGTKWLTRSEVSIQSKEQGSAFVVVWKTINKTIPGEVLKKQGEMIVDLWKDGVIENIYFDGAGTLEENDITDFVFYIKAMSEIEARELVHALPFYRHGIARYNLYPVGVLWLDRSIVDSE